MFDCCGVELVADCCGVELVFELRSGSGVCCGAELVFDCCGVELVFDCCGVENIGANSACTALTNCHDYHYQ